MPSNEYPGCAARPGRYRRLCRIDWAARRRATACRGASALLSNPRKDDEEHLPAHSGFRCCLALHASSQKTAAPAQWTVRRTPPVSSRTSAPRVRINYATVTKGATSNEFRCKNCLIAAARCSEPKDWPALAAQVIKGRIAIIAPAFGASNDEHPTPHSTGPLDNMLGAEIEANVIETLLSGRFFHRRVPAAGCP